MNQKQFDVLVGLKFYENTKISQRKLANFLKVSLGSVNKMISDLNEMGYITDYTINDKGHSFLEDHKVKRAIIMAAGLGERLMPLTLTTAEPLIDINGKRIINTILDSLLKQGIDDIYIVRGHLKEQFEILLKEYPMLKFIDNDLYNESKNIRTVYMARDLLEGAYMIEGDLLIHNPDLISPYQLHSSYYGKPVELTHDWCFTTRSGIITDVAIGGEKVHEMVGISYWKPSDAVLLKQDIEYYMSRPGGMELFWDDVPLKLAKDKYQVYIRDAQAEDVTEINTYSQLQSLDSKYQK